MSSRYGGISTGRKLKMDDGSYRTIYEGERGGLFVIFKGMKIYTPSLSSPVAIPITDVNSLRSIGYGARKSARQRRAALRWAVQLYGYTSVERKINALYVFNKNRHPDLAAIFEADKSYLRTLRINK